MRPKHNVIINMGCGESHLILPALRYGRHPGSQFSKALLIPKRIAPTCPVPESRCSVRMRFGAIYDQLRTEICNKCKNLTNLVRNEICKNSICAVKTNKHTE